MIKKCVFIDVFTNSPYAAGNQLAVFPHAENLNSDQMQSLANEINYSETTFVSSANDNNADFEIRIFTPKMEVPFAGHPTLGTAFAIDKITDLWSNKKGFLRLKTKVGVIPVEFKDDVVWMKQNKPEFLKQYTDKKLIADLVGLLPEDISDALPMEEVSTGNKILILPIQSLSSIKKAYGNAEKLARFYEETGCLAPYLFTKETVEKESRIHSRFFAPHAGILEDPATGSAAGPLTAYLLKHNVFGSEFDLINEQGYEMKRPSKIFMRGTIANDEYGIYIGGCCAYVGKGEFEI
jgi:trans-2,3-dihydro-3-hydroxyanthranilate isomerase